MNRPRGSCWLCHPRKQYETSFKGRLKSYFLRSDECKNFLCFLSYLKTRVRNIIEAQRVKQGPIKINMVVECIFVNVQGDQCDRAFKTFNKPILMETDIDKFNDLSFDNLNTELEESKI